jgi:hypothetical protein
MSVKAQAYLILAYANELASRTEFGCLKINYGNLLITTSAMQQKISMGSSHVSSASVDEKIKGAAKGMLMSFIEMCDVLESPSQEYSGLQHFLVRILAGNSLTATIAAAVPLIKEVRRV